MISAMVMMTGVPAYKSIALGKEKFGLPEKEEHQWTNLIR